MKIAMISLRANPLTALRDPDVTGQRLHVAKLAEALHRRGHDLTVYTRQTDRRVPARRRIGEGFEVVHGPAGPVRELGQNDVVPHIGEFARFLNERWAGDPPDVIHAHHWTSGLAAVLSARRTAIPIVQSFHGLEGGDSTGIERLVGRGASGVIATSAHEARELGRLGVRRSRISIVPWGVDTRIFTVNGPTAPRNGMPRILAVGADGADDLIVALTMVTWTELVVAGNLDDVELQRLRALAARHCVSDRVGFLGRVPHSDMPALIRSADVVACAQRHEPFGVVPLEAMACGVPVVASAVGGLAESVVHEVTGVHVPPRKPAVLARALRSLVGDDIRRQELGAAGQDRTRVRYAWDRVALDVVRAYQQATGPEVLAAQERRCATSAATSR
ncbi:glycosyltransferase [Lentzea flava]|uniref:Glycosyl transferase n=1 Tax=Lentzea flava TaxID=103732 RepID=A0ABQ2VB48_9PSEU|nr:glycosyltransferase [Lentzea flava]MCP2204389.1 Glycosyltransferase involved in cell wall bisynthesis [Lentzea flava]GGU77062.1 glycosyl transferase [Lentzea flava]